MEIPSIEKDFFSYFFVRKFLLVKQVLTTNESLVPNSVTGCASQALGCVQVYARWWTHHVHSSCLFVLPSFNLPAYNRAVWKNRKSRPNEDRFCHKV